MCGTQKLVRKTIAPWKCNTYHWSQSNTSAGHLLRIPVSSMLSKTRPAPSNHKAARGNGQQVLGIQHYFLAMHLSHLNNQLHAHTQSFHVVVFPYNAGPSKRRGQIENSVERMIFFYLLKGFSYSPPILSPLLTCTLLSVMWAGSLQLYSSPSIHTSYGTGPYNRQWAFWLIVHIPHLGVKD